MIRVTRLNGVRFALNADLIREIEAAPDTILTLTSGEKMIVRESVDEVVSAVIEYQQRIRQAWPTAERTDSPAGNREV